MCAHYRPAQPNRTPRPELHAPVTIVPLPSLGVHLQGVSVAGVETWLRVPEWSLGFDIGRCPELAVRSKYIALSHAHMDHAAGLAMYLALRKMYGLTPTTVFAPAAACDDLLAMVHSWERMHGREFPWILQPVVPGEEYSIGGGRFLRTFAVDHVVPAIGYCVTVRSHRLRDDLSGETAEQLRHLRDVGQEMSSPIERILLAVTGDTRAHVTLESPETVGAEVLVAEATFVDSLRTVAEAQERGHTHLDELAQFAERLAHNRQVVLYHISQIHSVADARRALKGCLPPALLAKTSMLLPPS